MPAISIIVPVYNVSEYLDRCFTSILSQTFSDFEVIVINDGSTDESGIICDKWADADSRIAVFHIDNGGVANARNLGLSKSIGSYVYFLDPDDWIEEDLLKDNFDIALRTQGDVVIFGFFKEQEINGKNVVIKVPPPKMAMYSKADVREQLVNLLKKTNGFSVWTKLIRKQFLIENDIVFPLMKRGQDMAFSLEVYRNAESIFVNDQCYYHYNAFSNAKKFDPKIFENHLALYNKLFGLFANWMDSNEALRYAVKLFIMWFGYVVPANIIGSTGLSKREKLGQLKRILHNGEIRGFIKRFKIVKGLSFQSRLYLWVFRSSNVQLFFTTVKLARTLNTNSKFNFKKLF